ncbi:thioredoxin fold domain-containing protein [Pseudoduganella violaceinigra]|uniref:thioredoxin fold domain-containing protein n=1 Tax=Pseudoduganella violaceinigra TaxID=246602 RepID=UPI00048237B5|nr:thioredoxin fold domain-containing protein [Pseudoduganella violaceinigra]
MLFTPSRRARIAALALALGACALPAHADLSSVRSVLAERLKAKNMPFSPSSVQETLITGLYRMDTGPGQAVLFVNDAVTLMLITDNVTVTEWSQPVRDPQPISQEEKTELLKEMMRNIRFDKLIKIDQGNAKNKLLLVSAYDCPYCIKFERMLNTAGSKVDASVYVLPSTLNPKENARASTVRNIWCARDNANIWRKTLVNGSGGYFNLPGSSCDLGVQQSADLQLLMRTLYGRDGYPSMIFANGVKTTPGQDWATFEQQMRQTSDSDFWGEPNPQKYAQFRAEAAAASSTVVNPLNSLFKRFGIKNK